MGTDANFNSRRAAAAPPANVAGKRELLHPALDSSPLINFQGRRLSGRQPPVNAALRKGPASAAGLNQQELNATAANPIAHCGDLLTFPQPANLRYSKDPSGRLSSRCL